MATGGTPFDDCGEEQELHNWTVTNGSLEDRLNNMVQTWQKTEKLVCSITKNLAKWHRVNLL